MIAQGNSLSSQGSQQTTTEEQRTAVAACVPASACWLSRLELMAVQPACLTAHPDTPLPQQQGPQQAPAQQEQQVQHELLLHLEATLTNQQPAQTGHGLGDAAGQHVDEAAVAAAAAAAQSAASLAPAEAPETSPAQPLLLSAAELQLVLFAGLSEVRHQQQINLQQLVLQQQQQQQQQLVMLPADAASSSGISSSRTSQTWTVPLSLHVSMPCEPTEQLLAALHLILMVSAAGMASAGSGETATQHRPTPAAAAAVGLVAGVPLLVMPAAAQQEVQQLLLPAMRQEVQAEQQQQQQQREVSASMDDFARQCMQVEHAAWQHFCQLSHDIYAVMLLAAAAEAAATAPSTAAADEAANEVAEAQVDAAAAGAVELAPPAAALANVAESLLFPLLLPFLAAHGLHNTLQVVLGCLPQHLQQQWWQQQLDRLQELEAAAPPALHLQALPVEQEHLPAPAAAASAAVAAAGAEGSEGPGPAPPAVAAASEAADVEVSGQQPLLLGQVCSLPSAPHAAMAAATLSEAAAAGTIGSVSESSSSKPNSSKSSSSAARKRTSSSSAEDRDTEKEQPGSLQAAHTRGVAAAAAAAGGGVPWYLPLTQFDRDREQRYLAWKHSSLLHLDYFAAIFDLLYLVVLLKRMMREPSVFYFFLFILIKTLPHVPLMLGLRRTFLRWRETWLLLVAPTCVLIATCVALHSTAQGRPPPMLMSVKAYRAYWNSRGELPTSIMQAFLHHMRLRPYMLYTLLDAALSAWVFAQVFGVWEAVGRWGFAAALSIGLCWGLELHMRRRFVRRHHV